jgi:small-conductance mechanosensitive channel
MEFLERIWDRLVKDFGARFNPEQWSKSVQHLFDSLIVLLVAILVIWFARRFLTRVEQRIESGRGANYRRRIETVTSLINSTVKYAVYIAAGMAILGTWGLVDSASLAFGTAAIGAAVGFGAQGLVQDVITGLSILAEDQLAVGDYVEIGGKSGVVEEIGLRVIKLRDSLGVQHVIFNRTIALVSNFTAGAVQAVVDVSLEKADAADAAKKVAGRVCQDLSAEIPFFTEVPQVEGVQQSSTHDIFLRIRLRVLPQQQAIINEIFVDRLKRAFAAENIVIPEGRVRVVIVSDLFTKQIGKVKPSALPVEGSGTEKTLEGAV